MRLPLTINPGPRLRIAQDAFYDAAGNVIETHEYAGDFKEP